MNRNPLDDGDIDPETVPILTNTDGGDVEMAGPYGPAKPAGPNKPAPQPTPAGDEGAPQG